MKILVVGFPRSGTSLTWKIFNNHPEVKGMLFEKWALKQGRNKTELIRRHPMFKKTAGEKVIWEKRVIGKIGRTKETIVDYCKKWNLWFEDEARIIQIVRHPFDSLNSLVLSKYRFPRGPGFDLVYIEYLNFAKRFVNAISQLPNVMTIKYENLVSEPDIVIKNLYQHCNIDASHKHEENMKTGRIFNYKHKNFLFEYNEKLEDIIDSFNKINGMKYEGK